MRRGIIPRPLTGGAVRFRRLFARSGHRGTAHLAHRQLDGSGPNRRTARKSGAVPTQTADHRAGKYEWSSRRSGRGRVGPFYVLCRVGNGWPLEDLEQRSHIRGPLRARECAFDWRARDFSPAPGDCLARNRRACKPAELLVGVNPKNSNHLMKGDDGGLP